MENKAEGDRDIWYEEVKNPACSAASICRAQFFLRKKTKYKSDFHLFTENYRTL